MGVSSSESHDLTAFYELLTASFGVLSQNTGFYPSLDRIIETTLGPLNLGPRGGCYKQPRFPPQPKHTFQKNRTQLKLKHTPTWAKREILLPRQLQTKKTSLCRQGAAVGITHAQ